MTSVSEEGAHARNRFENRRLRKTMEHIAFTQRYAQSRIDDEIRNVRDSLRDIRLNTGHSSNMDSEGVRSFCRGEYMGNRQKRAAEQIERGECFDWTLTLERDASTVRVPDTERRHRSSKRGDGVRRSASLTSKTSVTELPLVGDEGESPMKRSSSFHTSNKRASLRRSRQERATRTTFPNPLPPDSRVKRAESFQDSRPRPSSGLRRSSSVTSLVSCSGKRAVSVERSETIPLILDADIDLSKQHPNSNHETVKFPQISKASSGSMDTLHVRQTKTLSKSKRKVGRKVSESNDIDLTQLVQELMLEDLITSDSVSSGSRREPTLDKKRAKLKVRPKKDRPAPPVLAWEANSSNDLTLPAVVPTDARPRFSTSCPLPERQNPEGSKTRSRKLSCPEEDEQTKLRMDAECDIVEDDVFSISGGDAASGAQEEEEVPLSKYARRKKVLNARAAHSGMSLAELIAKRQGDIKVAMSPRQLRRIREQIILQRNRRDYSPSAGEQARFRQIEDKVRSFLDQEIFSSEGDTGTDSYNSEEEGSLV